MATTEQSRRRLHRELTDVMGEERASMLVDHLPPFDWTELATKRDLADVEQRLDARFDELRIEMATKFAIVDARFEGMAATFNARFDAIGYRFDAMDSRFEGLATKEFVLATKEQVLGCVNDLRVELHRDMRTLTLTLFFGNAALAGLVAFLTQRLA